MKIITKLVSLFLVGAWLVVMYQAKFGQDSLIKAAPDILVFGLQRHDVPSADAQHNHIIAFDVDLTQALATRIGKKRVIRQLEQEQLVSELSQHGVHVIAQTIDTRVHNEDEEDEHTENNASSLLFSHPYLEQDTSRRFVLSKNNAALLTLIDNALDEMKEDGTITELKKKWNIS